MNAPARGDVWWVERPEEKRRPYVVLTRSPAVAGLVRVIAVPVTSRIRGLPTELKLGPNDGLTRECVATFDNVKTIRKAHLVDRICTLGPDRMAEACVALRAAVDC